MADQISMGKGVLFFQAILGQFLGEDKDQVMHLLLISLFLAFLCLPSLTAAFMDSLQELRMQRCVNLGADKGDLSLDAKIELLQVPYDRREELLIKGGVDPKKDLVNLSLKYTVRSYLIRSLGESLYLSQLYRMSRNSLCIVSDLCVMQYLSEP